MRSALILAAAMSLAAAPPFRVFIALAGPPEAKDVKRLALSPDGARLAAVLDKSILVWDVRAAKPVRSLAVAPRDQVQGLHWLPDGRLVSVEWSRPRGKDAVLSCRVWDVAKGEERSSFPARSRPGQIWSDGKTLRLAGWDGLEQHDLKGKGEARFTPWRGGPSTAVGPGGRFAAHANHQDIDLFEAATGKAIGTLPDHLGQVRHLAFGPGDLLLAANIDRVRRGVSEHEIVVWDVPGRKLKLSLTLHDPNDLHVTGFSFLPNGRGVAVGYWARVRSRLVMLDLTGSEIARLTFPLPDSTIHDIRFSADGRTLAFRMNNRSVHLYRVNWP